MNLYREIPRNLRIYRFVRYRGWVVFSVEIGMLFDARGGWVEFWSGVDMFPMDRFDTRWFPRTIPCDIDMYMSLSIQVEFKESKIKFYWDSSVELADYLNSLILNPFTKVLVRPIYTHTHTHIYMYIYIYEFKESKMKSSWDSWVFWEGRRDPFFVLKHRSCEGPFAQVVFVSAVCVCRACVLQCVAVFCSVVYCVALCCIVLQCVAVCNSVLQRVAMCCSLLDVYVCVRLHTHVRKHACV